MEDELALQETMADPMAFANTMSELIIFAASPSDPNDIYMHEAMCQPDKKEFGKAMKKEVSSYEDN
jgi:hypothetical protein